MRDIKIETYWKMQNSFQVPSIKNNTFKKYIELLHNATDKKLNSMSIKEWDECSIDESEAKMEELRNKIKSLSTGNRVEVEEIKKMLEENKELQGLVEDENKSSRFKFFQESKSIEYFGLPLVLAYLISFTISKFEELGKDKEKELYEFIFNNYKKIIYLNQDEDKKHFNEVNLEFPLLTFTNDQEWIVKMLSDLSIFGYKIIVTYKNNLILPFWDWTFNYIFISFNEKRKKKNEIEKKNSFLIEDITRNLIPAWNIKSEDIFENKNFSINNKKGEVDFAFIKNKVLYVFENKDITDMNNPIEKNEKAFNNWFKDNIEYGLNQLIFISENAKDIFKNCLFERVVPILCTTSRNRFEPDWLKKYYKVKIPSNLVLLDVESLTFILFLKKGFELLLFYSYFMNLEFHTGLSDFSDLVGILNYPSFNLPMEKFAQHLDFNYLFDCFEFISEDDGESSFNNEWAGDFRFIIIQKMKILYDKEELMFGEGFLKAINRFGDGKKIKILKHIFGKDVFYDKYEKKLICKFL